MPLGGTPYQAPKQAETCQYTFYPTVDYGKWTEAQFQQLQTVFVLLFFLVVFWFILTLRKNRGWFAKEDK